jgi:flagellar protein FliL
VAKDKVKEASPEAEAAEGAEGEEAGGGKKKLPLKMMIIAGAAALVVLGGGGTAAFMVLKPKPDAAHAEKGDHKKEKKKKEKKAEKGEKKEGEGGQVTEGPDGVLFYAMPDITVNMQSTDGRATFLKLKLTLELPDEGAVETLDPNMPRLQDMFQSFLRELRPEDLAGSQGTYQLRMEILRRVNLVIAPTRANAVLIEEMLIN